MTQNSGPGSGRIDLARSTRGARIDTDTRVPVPTLRSMIFAYPTSHRGVPDALAALT